MLGGRGVEVESLLEILPVQIPLAVNLSFGTIVSVALESGNMVLVVRIPLAESGNMVLVVRIPLAVKLLFGTIVLQFQAKLLAYLSDMFGG